MIIYMFNQNVGYMFVVSYMCDMAYGGPKLVLLAVNAVNLIYLDSTNIVEPSKGYIWVDTKRQVHILTYTIVCESMLLIVLRHVDCETTY